MTPSPTLMIHCLKIKILQMNYKLCEAIMANIKELNHLLNSVKFQKNLYDML